VALVCLVPLASVSAATESPRAVVEATISGVLAVLGDASLSTPEKRRRVEEIVYTRVDFDTLSRLVLARNWNQLSEPQRDEFIQEFKKHLSLTYGRNVDNYKNERSVVLGDRQEAKGDWTVRTKIVRGGGSDDILVDYRLRQKDGEWRIIDVIIESVSLVSNFRSQFQQIMANGGAQKLLEVLREKNARGEPLKS
jgi:phospholipid transport system substrate-binding protein